MSISKFLDMQCQILKRIETFDVSTNNWSKRNFLYGNNVYLKNKNHAINAPWNTLLKPQYTLRRLIIEFLLRFSFRKQQFDFVTPRNIFFKSVP